MLGYSVLETAVRDEVLLHFSALLTEDTCVVDDHDSLWNTVFETNADYACLLDVGVPAGRKQFKESFATPTWTWRIFGIIAVRYDRATIKTRARAVIDLLATLFADDHTLGTRSVKAEVVQIDDPEEVRVNDVAFSFIGFMVEVWDR